ncbi:Phytochrome-like protein cph2 [Fundidesulfovibrio magnetotacticus]|uniref:diguanylate cyclase n=1 Tax=Fundidesulfovibrio magnetotacticus TaxID=2730080 RepID=A0A6V8LWH4_9BACT|nr:diguanylate cyclase [Fundidesulfovibrio magnetotacticus]GFK96084.1 Phytochrome-like protein cph2 [Fundidesulfovibrio magnetotacticus]
MDHPVPLFDKEQQVAAAARQALAATDCTEFARPFGELVEAYEDLLERSRRVAEAALEAQMDLEAALTQVAQLSEVDGLTGVLNRRAFEKLLARDWAQAQREGSSLSLLVVNVDRFAAYNAVNGSLAGDDALKAAAGALMRCLYREVDAAGRMEGDTFAALLPGSGPDGARVVAARILDEVARLEIPHLDSPHGGLLTVSAGVASVTPGRGDAPMLLVRQAQQALGVAKQEGGNAFALA